MSSLSWNPEWPLRFMSNQEFMKEPPNMVTGQRHAVGQKIWGRKGGKSEEEALLSLSYTQFVFPGFSN